MRFLYHPDAGAETIVVEGEAYRHLFRVRRQKAGEETALRNLNDDGLYTYRIEKVTRREATLRLIGSEAVVVMPGNSLHLGWCLVDPKTVEKTLPFLNELGVGRITFIRCDRSQHNFRLDFERLRRILINSSQQCGRSRLMELTECESIDRFLEAFPQSAVLDFGGEDIRRCEQSFEAVVVGCEGGFSERERKIFKEKTIIIGMDTPLVLRSETAAISVAAIEGGQ